MEYVVYRQIAMYRVKILLMRDVTVQAASEIITSR